MKKYLIMVLFLLICGYAYSADSEVQDLDAIVGPTGTDVLYVVDDPGGSPASKKITIGNLLVDGLIPDTISIDYASSAGIAAEASYVSSSDINWQNLQEIQSGDLNWTNIEVVAPITEAMIGDLGAYITAAEVAANETDSAHDTCAEITGCVESAITGNETITITGDVSGSGTTAITAGINWANIQDLVGEAQVNWLDMEVLAPVTEAMIGDLGTYLTVEVDGSTSNELQDLSIDGNTLSLSDSVPTIDLSGYLDNTDDQTCAEVSGCVEGALTAETDPVAGAVTGLVKSNGSATFSAASIDTTSDCDTGDVCGPGHTHSSYAPSTAPTFATSITGSYLTASEILITDGSKNIVSAPVATYPSLTELSYVKGLSSAVQTQLGGKQATVTEGSLADSVVVSADIKDGEVSGSDMAAAIDLGGKTSLEIPNGANPTTDALGEVAFDSDDFAVEVYDGSASRLIPSVQVIHKVLADPDSLQAQQDAWPIFNANPSAFPGGITLVSSAGVASDGIRLFADVANTASVALEEWTGGTNPTYVSTIETITFVSTRGAAPQSALDDANIAAGNQIWVDLDTTDLKYLEISIPYYIKENN